MTKKYLSPETEVFGVTIESNILSNGEDLNIRTYGSEAGEDVDGFWN